jgi:hypothetical protein
MRAYVEATQIARIDADVQLLAQIYKEQEGTRLLRGAERAHRRLGRSRHGCLFASRRHRR